MVSVMDYDYIYAGQNNAIIFFCIIIISISLVTISLNFYSLLDTEDEIKSPDVITLNNESQLSDELLILFGVLSVLLVIIIMVSIMCLIDLNKINIYERSRTKCCGCYNENKI